MMIAIGSIKEIDSKHGGKVFRLDGHYVNEFENLSKCYTFIDPKNENFAYWSEVLHTIASNRGKFVELDNCKMKDRRPSYSLKGFKPRAVIVPSVTSPKNV